MGDLFQYDQDGPEGGEITAWPGERKDFPGTSERTRPPGNDGAQDRDEYDASSAKVIPDSMGEEIRDQLTYAASLRVASRYREAAKIEDLLAKTGPEVQARATGLKVSTRRFNPDTGFWAFTVLGSKGEPYYVRVKGVRPSKSVTRLGKADVKVSCSCNFWRWQGPEHWGKVNAFLYGKPRGTASVPVIRDPTERHWLCKHLVAVLDLAKDYRFSDSVKRVAARYASSP